MSDHVAEHSADAAAHQDTYKSVMRFATEFGVPFAIALTMFFTNLVMANGLPVAIAAAVVTHFFVFFVVKAFFSH